MPARYPTPHVASTICHFHPMDQSRTPTTISRDFIGPPTHWPFGSRQEFRRDPYCLASPYFGVILRSYSLFTWRSAWGCFPASIPLAVFVSERTRHVCPHALPTGLG